MSTLEIIKAVLSKLLEPYTFLVLAALLYCLWSCLSDRFRSTRKFVRLGLVVALYLASLPIFHPYTRPSQSDIEYQPPPASLKVDYILVLGCGNLGDLSLPLSNQLSQCSMRRLVEGVLLHRRFPQSELIVTGGKGFFEHSNADVMKQLAIGLGVPENSIITEPTGHSTVQEITALEPVLRGKNTILVTSAKHVSRAMALLAPIANQVTPAPTMITVYNNEPFSILKLLPSAYHLHLMSKTIHEKIVLILTLIMSPIQSTE